MVMTGEHAASSGQQDAPALVVTFWNLALENFPEGTFRRSTLPVAEAAALINASKAAGRAIFATADNLAAPYRKPELRKTSELATVLSGTLGININIRDFFSPAGEDGLEFPIPLNVIKITPDRPLLVVTCNYMDDEEKRGDSLDDLGFRVAPDSVKFRLFEIVQSDAEIGAIRAHLIAAEQRGSSTVSREDSLAEIKEEIMRG